MPSEINSKKRQILKKKKKERQILCDSTYIRYLEGGKITETENSLGDGGEKEFCDSSFG